MQDTKFTIEYDDQPEDIIDRISNVLSQFGLSIEVVDEGDGYIEYEIVGDGPDEE